MRKQAEATKKARGTTRPDRASENVVDFPKLGRPPDPPKWLKSPTARAEWRRLADLLHAARVLTPADSTMLAHTCALHAEVVEALDRDEIVQASKRAELRRCFAEFGLTPSARVHVPAGNQQRENPFLRNGVQGKEHG